jgi:hypothetical protein
MLLLNLTYWNCPTPKCVFFIPFILEKKLYNSRTSVFTFLCYNNIYNDVFKLSVINWFVDLTQAIIVLAVSLSTGLWLHVDPPFFKNTRENGFFS